jgi:branched-chain amino acid transport system substrate-binding protein
MGAIWGNAVVLGLTVAVATIGPVESQDVVRFGASLSLTGATSTEGKRVKDGYDFYVRHINERGGIKVGDRPYKVAITYYDDESNPQTATRLVEKLIVDDKVNFLLGPYGSGTTLPASSVSEKHEIPMDAAHGASTPIYTRGYKYIFGVLNTVDQYTEGMLKMAADQNPKPQTVALINENALFPQLGIDAAAKQAEGLGLKVVYKEKYPTGIKDLSSMLADARAKQPDVVIAGGYTADMILLTRQASEMGLQPKVFGFLLGPTLPGFVSSLHEAAEGLLEPVQWAASMGWKDEIFGWTAGEFAELFHKEFGYEPDYHPPQSAAAIEVYQRALEKAGSLDPKKVRDAIAATDLMTFYGPIKFDQRGVNIGKSMAVVQIQNGKPQVVYPASAATAKLVYPRS